MYARALLNQALSKNSSFWYFFLMTEKSAQILNRYKHTTGLTSDKLCYLFSISRRSIVKYLQGAPIHPKVAYRIEQVTHGELKAIDLIDPLSIPGKIYLSKKT